MVVPPTELKWLLEQPDTVINNQVQLQDILQWRYTLMDDSYADSALNNKLISRTLTQQIGELSDAIYEETAVGVDLFFGSVSGEEKEVNVYEELSRVVARTSNRVFVGLPLCRNDNFIKHAIDFTMSVMGCAFILRRIPGRLRDVFAPLVLYRHRKLQHAIKSSIAEEVNARYAETDKAEKRNDFLQWLIDRATADNDTRELEPEVIATRLMGINFAALHTSLMSITNTFFHVVSGDNAAQRMAGLRDEVESVFAEYGTFSKQAVAQLVKVDSAFKESGRLEPLNTVSMERKVLQPGGVTTPVSNTFIPQGSCVAVPTLMIHTDQTHYDNPHQYDAERFAGLRSPAKAEGSDTGSGPKGPNLAFSTTSPAIMHFGHGRHACPGRFFASHELKVMLAYILIKYDIEPLKVRPETKTVGSSNTCPSDARVRVRRR